MSPLVLNNTLLAFVAIPFVMNLVQTIANLMATSDKSQFEVIDLVNLALGVAKFILLGLAALGLGQILDLGP